MTEERPTERTPAQDAQTPGEEPAATVPAYTPPTYTPPPVPPPASPQPAVAWAPPPTATVAGQRTTLSLAAGILLVVLGVLGGLASLLILTIGREFARQFDFTNMPGIDAGGADVGAIAGSAVTFVGIVLLVCSAFYIIGGVGAMRSKDWGRVIGIIIGILAGLFWLAGLTNGGQGRGDGIGFALVLLAIHAYVAIALLFFWRNKAPAG
jgi:hypothetical protein